MSARWRAPARPPGAGLPPRGWSLAILVPLLGTLVVHAASAANAPPAARRLDPAQARGEGLPVQLVAHPELPAGVLEVRPLDGATFGGVLLEAAPDGASAALADASGRSATGVVLVRADGSQLHVAVEGVLDATYAGDGSSLAVVDGLGRLWLVDASSGAARRIADGPFLAVPLVEGNGSVIALSVPSVEAPFRSALVRLDPDGETSDVSDEELVYGAFRLTDGSLAVVSHRPTGTVVQRVAAEGASLHADLGLDAVNVSVSADGQLIAWETAGQAFIRRGSGAARSLGAGSSPVVAPDGSAILLSRDGTSVLVDAEGRPLARLAAAAFVPCVAGCRP